MIDQICVRTPNLELGSIICTPPVDTLPVMLQLTSWEEWSEQVRQRQAQQEAMANGCHDY